MSSTTTTQEKNSAQTQLEKNESILQMLGAEKALLEDMQRYCEIQLLRIKNYVNQLETENNERQKV